MSLGLRQQKAAVTSGYWPLLRYNPSLRDVGKNPFQLDSRPPAISLEQYAYKEGRYTMLAQSDPKSASDLLGLAQKDVNRRWRLYKNLAAMSDTEVT
jgi:pyruvate-ferredoxin/flavodoxin oxidoreductase